MVFLKLNTLLFSSSLPDTAHIGGDKTKQFLLALIDFCLMYLTSTYSTAFVDDENEIRPFVKVVLRRV